MGFLGFVVVVVVVDIWDFGILVDSDPNGGMREIERIRQKNFIKKKKN